MWFKKTGKAFSDGCAMGWLVSNVQVLTNKSCHSILGGTSSHFILFFFILKIRIPAFSALLLLLNGDSSSKLSLEHKRISLRGLTASKKMPAPFPGRSGPIHFLKLSWWRDLFPACTGTSLRILQAWEATHKFVKGAARPTLKILLYFYWGEILGGRFVGSRPLGWGGWGGRYLINCFCLHYCVERRGKKKTV